jgi:hypothetical protein
MAVYGTTTSGATAMNITRLVAGAAVAAGLLACGSTPPPPAWQQRAHDASDDAVQAYLQGEQRVAQQQWRKAFDAVAATGDVQRLARMVLLQCAAQTAALQWSDCPAYAPLEPGAAGAEQAYARYLQAQHTARDVALLRSLPPGQPPLSQLTAAAVALRAGALAPAAANAAMLLAAEHGWRRAAMAWAQYLHQQALQQGDAAGAAALAQRLQILQSPQGGVAQP